MTRNELPNAGGKDKLRLCLSKRGSAIREPRLSVATPVRNTGEVGFAIVFVCTGNVCRSPMAELLTRAWSTPASGVVASSLGTAALVGEGVAEPAASLLTKLGVDPSGHRARQYEPWLAADADLVLTAERAHRDAILAELPSALRRTFTMREFARIVRQVPAGPPRLVVARAAESRHLFAADEAEDDIPDPYRRGPERAEVAARLVVDAVHATLGALGFARATPRPVRRPRPYPRVGMAR